MTICPLRAGRVVTTGPPVLAKRLQQSARKRLLYQTSDPEWDRQRRRAHVETKTIQGIVATGASAPRGAAPRIRPTPALQPWANRRSTRRHFNLLVIRLERDGLLSKVRLRGLTGQVFHRVDEVEALALGEETADV